MAWTQNTEYKRITPAYAGKSPQQICSRRRNRDHPRVCGEKRSRFKMKQDIKGSPPRMRGKVLKIYIVDGTLGITPAYAGKSRVNAERVAW